MRRLLTIAVLVATLVSTAAAATSERIVATVGPGGFVERRSSAAFGRDAVVQAGVFVAGRELALQSRGGGAEASGRGVIVTLSQRGGTGPIIARMANVRRSPVRVVVLLRWSR